MLPNIKTEASVLQKILAAEFGHTVARHKALEITSLMKGFADYQSLQRGIEKIERRLFEGKVIHLVTGASYVSHQAAVCALLSRIMQAAAIRHFAVDTRGNGLEGKQDTAALLERMEESIARRNAGIPRAGHGASEAATDSYLLGSNRPDRETTYTRIAYHPSLDEMNVFGEVFNVRERESDHAKAEEILRYAIGGGWSSGIVAGGFRAALADSLVSKGDFSVVHHLAVASSYKTSAEGFRMQLAAIRACSPDGLIVVWVFESEDGQHYSEQPRVVYPDAAGRFERRRVLVDGIGYVEEVNIDGGERHGAKFALFDAVSQAAREQNLPVLKVPHFSSMRIFESNEDQLTPTMLGERDTLASSVASQMASLRLTIGGNT